ncbi:MAG: hypothetical protein JSU58_03160 [Dehalococcoidales bacterium]|nr:MAG: hypothetical protein JSU58_03160 [Dehalococcoidales bacterium]
MGVVYTYFGEHMIKAASEAEQSVESLKHGNSGGRPPRNSRDTQVLLCSITGIVIGGIGGVIIGINMTDTGGLVPGFFGGIIIGGLIGSFVGEYLKRQKYRKLEHLTKKFETDNKQGPLLS